MIRTGQSLLLPVEAGRGTGCCHYGARTLRRSLLLATSRPWQVVAAHVPRGEVPVSVHRS